MKRGDVVIAQFPYADRRPAVYRPCLVVQADYYNQRIKNVLLATITTNLNRRNDPAHLFIDVSAPDGQRTGLLANSLVSCLNLAVLPATDVGQKVGEFSPAAMQQINNCLKAALEIP
jgi:mRNA interferase MazF